MEKETKFLKIDGSKVVLKIEELYDLWISLSKRDLEHNLKMFFRNLDDIMGLKEIKLFRKCPENLKGLIESCLNNLGMRNVKIKEGNS